MQRRKAQKATKQRNIHREKSNLWKRRKHKRPDSPVKKRKTQNMIPKKKRRNKAKQAWKSKELNIVTEHEHLDPESTAPSDKSVRTDVVDNQSLPYIDQPVKLITEVPFNT